MPRSHSPAQAGSFQFVHLDRSVAGEAPPRVVSVTSWGNGVLRELGALRREHPTASLHVQAPRELGELLGWSRDLTAIGIGGVVTSPTPTEDVLRAALPDPMGLGPVLDGWLRLCHPGFYWKLPLAPSAWVAGAVEHSTLTGSVRKLDIPRYTLPYRVGTTTLAEGVGLKPAGKILRYTRAMLMGVLFRKYPTPGKTLAREYFELGYRSLSEAFQEAFRHTLEETRKRWGWEELAERWVQAISRSDSD